MISLQGYTETDGVTFTGLYAPDGTTYVVDSSEEDGPVGIYHPCGAHWVTFTDNPDHEVYAPNGSLYVYREEDEEEN